MLYAIAMGQIIIHYIHFTVSDLRVIYPSQNVLHFPKYEIHKAFKQMK